MPRPHKYPPELRERATRMVFEMRERTGERRGAIARVADQLGIHREALRGWIRQAEIDGGQRPGVPTEERQRIAELEREVRELRRANEILKAASAFSPRSSTVPRRGDPDDRCPPGPLRGRADLPGGRRRRAGQHLLGCQAAATVSPTPA
jgi:transposase